MSSPAVCKCGDLINHHELRSGGRLGCIIWGCGCIDFEEPSKPCATCGADVDPLAVFPGGLCLDCYKATPEANAPLVAADVVRMWGGRALS